MQGEDGASSFMLGDMVKSYLATGRFLMPDCDHDEIRVQFVRGCHATLVALKELYDIELDELELAKDWKFIRDKIAVGIVKSSLDNGGISIPTYLASRYFLPLENTHYVGFLSSGSRGMKFQLFRKTNVITLICNDRYEGANRLEEVEAWLESLKPPNLRPPLDVFGYITGDAQNPATVTNNLFPSSVYRFGLLLDGNEQSYSMSSYDEGQMQIEGARLLYQQMGQLEQGHPPRANLVPIASLKIGMTTTQWTQHKRNSVTFPAGMRSPAVVEIGTGIVHHYRRNLHQFKALCKAAQFGISKGQVPTLDLQSGCLLLWSRNGRQFNIERQALSGIGYVSLKIRSHIVNEFALEVPIGSSSTDVCRLATLRARQTLGHNGAEFVCCLEMKVVSPGHDGRVLKLSTLNDAPTQLRHYEENLRQLADVYLPPDWDIPGDLPEWGHSSLPFAWSADKWMVAHDLWCPEEQKELAAGFRGGWSVLQRLFFCCSRELGGESALESVQVGLRASTWAAGNTSVAMGFATRFFENHQRENFVAFVKCGANAVKISLFARLPSSDGNEYRVALLGTSSGGVQFSKLDVNCSCVPNFGGEKTLRIRRLRLLLSALWQHQSLLNVPTFAYIVGPLRDHWESLEPQAAIALAKYVSQAFSAQDIDEAPEALEEKCACAICSGHEPQHFSIRPISDLVSNNGFNFFLPSRTEAHVEFVGIQRFYQQLTGGAVVAVLNVGEQHSRFTMLSSDLKQNDPNDENKFVICDTMPTNPPHKLPGIKGDVFRLGMYLEQAMKERNLISDLAHLLNPAARPLIVLKGCAQLLQGRYKESVDMRNMLAERPPMSFLEPEVKVKIARLDSGQADEITVRLPISCARLCAVAHDRFEDPKCPDFSHVYAGCEDQKMGGEGSQLIPLHGVISTMDALALNLMGTRHGERRVLYFSCEKCTTRYDIALACFLECRKYVYRDEAKFRADAMAAFPFLQDGQIDAYAATSASTAAVYLKKRIEFDAKYLAECAPIERTPNPPLPPLFSADLPLGMFVCDGFPRLGTAMCEQIAILHGIDARKVSFAGINLDSDLENHPTLSEYSYSVFILRPGLSPASVRRYGNGNTTIVVFLRDGIHYPVWSTRPPHEFKLWTKLRPFLGLTVHPLESLEEFKVNWGGICTFGPLLYNATLLDQVKCRIHDVVARCLQPETDDNFGAEKRYPWQDAAKWKNVLDTLRRLLAGSNRDFQMEVARAFQLRVRRSLKSAPQIFEEYTSILLNALGAENFGIIFGERD